MEETPEDPVYENTIITGKDKVLTEMKKMTEDNVCANVPVRPGKNKVLTEMKKMTEDNVYANVPVTPGRNKGILTPKKAKRRPKMTVGRAALLVVSLVIIAVVTAIIVIVYYNTQTKGNTEEMERTTVVPHTSPPQPVSTYGSPAVYYNTHTKGRTEEMERTTAVPHTSPPQPVSTYGSPAARSKNMPQCDEHWELHGEKCYYFSTATPKRSWDDSKKMCQGLKGNLVKIDSREEQEFLDVKVRSLMNNDMDRFWIGLTDSETEGKWLWTDGSQLNTSLMFWTRNKYNTEPDNWKVEDQDGENCAVIGETGYINGLNSWYDISCKKTNKSICQKPA